MRSSREIQKSTHKVEAAPVPNDTTWAERVINHDPQITGPGLIPDPRRLSSHHCPAHSSFFQSTCYGLQHSSGQKGLPTPNTPLGLFQSSFLLAPGWSTGGCPFFTEHGDTYHHVSKATITKGVRNRSLALRGLSEWYNSGSMPERYRDLSRKSGIVVLEAALNTCRA